jgi:hypothetical protein
VTFKVHSVAGVLRRGVLTTLANVPTCQLGPSTCPLALAP